MLPNWLQALRTRAEAVLETRAYGTVLLVLALGLPLVSGVAVIIMVVTFSWSVSPEFAWTWGLVGVAVTLASAGAVLSRVERGRSYRGETRKLMARATSGDRAAMAKLARGYAQGTHGLVRDPAQAAWWWRRLAQEGDPEGAYRWGRILLAGEGVMKDPAQGRSWLRIAAEAGHPGGLEEKPTGADGSDLG